MGQWFLQWGWAVALLVFAVSLTLMLYRSSVASWNKARGDWKTALMLEVGPFITFAAKVSIGAMVFMWATMYIYGAGQGSPVAQSFYKLGEAGVAAIGGSFQTYEVSIPDAGSLMDIAKGAIPSESDVRGVLGVPEPINANPIGGQSAPASSEWAAPQANTDMAPAEIKNLGSWSPNAIINTNGNWGQPATMGPQPRPTQGPALRPTDPPPPTQGPQQEPATWTIDLGGDGGPKTYTVQAGDSLSKIATQHGVSMNALCQANNLHDCNVVARGKKLVIP